MKNYLFAPFKDDKEKIAEFEHLNKTWNFSGDLIVFIGQLESSYDVIISEYRAKLSELRSQNAVAVADERIISKLQAENKDLIANAKEMKAEIKAEKLLNVDLLDVLTANRQTITKLKADIRHDSKVCEDYDDDLIKEIDELKAENERLKKGFGHGVLVELEQVDTLKDEVKELKEDNESLLNQVRMWSQ